MAADSIRPAAVRTGPAYEAARRESRERLAAAQADRRVDLGDDLALVFESQATVVAALEEELRSQRATDAAAVEAGAEEFGALLAPGGLTATLYVDVADPAALADRIAALRGVAATVVLEVGSVRVAGRCEAGPVLDAGAAHLVFPMAGEQMHDWDAGAPVAVVVDHPAVRRRVALSDAVRGAVGADLPSA
jgi:hypothetical protein